MAALDGGQLAFLRELAGQITGRPPALTGELETSMLAAAALIPGLLAELDAARSRLAVTCAEYAGLLAAVRAAVAADRAGEADPLGWVRDRLSARGQLPARAGVSVQVAADAAAALAMAGWPA